jgi:hypothetical protein
MLPCGRDVRGPGEYAFVFDSNDLGSTIAATSVSLDWMETETPPLVFPSPSEMGGELDRSSVGSHRKWEGNWQEARSTHIGSGTGIENGIGRFAFSAWYQGR